MGKRDDRKVALPRPSRQAVVPDGAGALLRAVEKANVEMRAASKRHVLNGTLGTELRDERGFGGRLWAKAMIYGGRKNCVGISRPREQQER
jgi:hypothetical protein